MMLKSNKQPQTATEKINNMETSTATTALSAEEAAFNRAEIMERLKNEQKVDYTEMKGCGFIFIYDTERNRSIHKSNRDELQKEFLEHGFFESIKVSPAATYIKEGHRLFDGDSKELTLETQDIDSYLVIDDGQHRVAAYESIAGDKSSNRFKVELSADYVSRDIYRDSINFKRAGWDSTDQVRSVAAKHQAAGETNISLINEWSSKYRLGKREAAKILELNDWYKKDVILDGMRDAELSGELKGTKEHIERGKKILNSFRMGFRNNQKLLRNSAAIDAFITSYNNASDEGGAKAERVDNLLLFFSSLGSSTIDGAEKESSVNEKKTVFLNAINVFLDEIKREDAINSFRYLAQKNETELEQIEKQNKSLKGGKKTR